MKKIFWSGVGIYFAYALAIGWYLFIGASADIPSDLRGTAVDPATFMTGEELKLSYEYSRFKHLLYFLIVPFEWLALFGIISFGLSNAFSRTSEAIFQKNSLRTAVYTFLLTLALFIIMFPFKWIGHELSVQYGVSVASFSIWMKDMVTDFWLNFVTLLVIGLWMAWIIQRSPKRWWVYTWLISIPFAVLIVFIQPIIIDPLYNDFYSLQDKDLEAKILALADQSNIPAEHVYEVNMSEKTNAMNAYVNGIGSSARIVLWDTTLQQLSDTEVLFIMAHEMAHYVYKHVFIGLAGYLILSLFVFWLIAKLLDWIRSRYKTAVEGLTVLPLLLLLLSLFSFVSSPLTNTVSREMERTADAYAVELTEDKQAAIGTFQQLTAAGLSEVQPPQLVYWFRYTHPSMLERLQKIEQYETADEEK